MRVGTQSHIFVSVSRKSLAFISLKGGLYTLKKKKKLNTRFSLEFPLVSKIRTRTLDYNVKEKREASTMTIFALCNVLQQPHLVTHDQSRKRCTLPFLRRLKGNLLCQARLALGQNTQPDTQLSALP